MSGDANQALVSFLVLMGALLAFAVPVVIGMVEGVKLVLPDLPTRFKPVVAIVCGEAFTVLLSLQLGGTWQDGAFAGFLAGLTAAGVYSFGKAREEAEAEVEVREIALDELRELADKSSTRTVKPDG